MIKAIKRLFTRPTSQVTAGRKFEAGESSRHSETYWLNASAGSIDALLVNKLEKLRNKARYVARNNSYAAGIVDTLANDTIGPGPRLQLETGQTARDSEIEDRFTAWAEDSSSIDLMRAQNLGEMLQGTIKGFISAGEDFYSQVVEDGGYKLQRIEPERIATPYGQSLSSKLIMGVEKDTQGRPTAYYISRMNPGASAAGLLNQYDRIPAEQILHLYRLDQAGQSRGVPWIAPALERFADYAQYNRAVIKAAEMAANISAITTGEDADSLTSYTTAADIPEFDIPINSILRMPGEQTITQLKAEQPTTTYTDFVRAIINEIARCLNMPLNIALANSSQYNYASGRLDHQVYWKFLDVIRSYLERHLLNPIFKRWLLAESFRLPAGVALSQVKTTWYWPGRTHVDPAKEANAQETKLQNGTATLADIWAEQGHDWRRKIDQLAEIADYAKSKGVTLLGGEREQAQPAAAIEPEGQPDNGESDNGEQEAAQTQSST